MTTEQRLDPVENDLATVRQLLVSAATYAESANRGLDQVTTRLDQLTVPVDQLTSAQTQTQAQLDQLTSAQTQTQAQLDQLTVRVDQLTSAQTQTQAQLDQLSSRVDEFVFHAQRLFTQSAGTLERVEGQSERLEAIVRRLDRNYEAQQSQLQEFKQTTNAALERIDRVLDYLLRQSGDGRGQG